MTSGLPSRIDRATLDRVLKRASELQGGGHDAGDLLTEEETVALGKEVGLTPELIKQALIEDRVRVSVEADHNMLDRMIAPANMMAQRVVQGSTPAILAAVTEWMDRNETLLIQRAQSDRITFEPMDHFARGMRRIAGAFRGGQRPFLDKAELVKLVVTPLDAGFSHVALGAGARGFRTGLVAGGAAIAACGALAGAAMTILGAPIVVGAALFAVAAASGVAVARLYRKQSERIRTGLERALDDLERNRTLAATAAPSLPRSDLARSVGQVMRDISAEVRKALKQ
jgi:hypothetical protein